MDKTDFKEMNREEERKALKKLQRKQSRKTPAKAAGLKSVMAVDKKVVLAAYGKGNDTIVEKIIKDNRIEDIGNPKKFDAKILKTQTKAAIKEEVTVDGRIEKDAKSDMPKGVRKDQLGAKDQLENIFFGKEFPEDNIRIQMIYNVMDIEKEYCKHITNAVYGVNHLNRNVHSEDDRAKQNDYIGSLFADDTIEGIKKYNLQQKQTNTAPRKGTKYDRFLDYLKGVKDEKGDRMNGAKDYLVYYEEAFQDAINEIQSEKTDEDFVEKEVYDRLCLLSLLRQSAVHGEKGFEHKIAIVPQHVLENPSYKRLKGILEKHYRNRVETIDRNFIENNKTKNLPILFDIYNAVTDKEKKELTIDFYNFIILKENKNMGFSLQKLREMLLLKEDYLFMKGEDFDTARHKLYSIVDFVIYKYYKEKLSNPSSGNEAEIVENLRSTKTEKEKNDIYEKEVNQLAQDIKSILTKEQMDKLQGNSIKNIRKDEAIQKSWLNGVKVSDTTPSDFTLVANYLTLFLDGKEINEFLSLLINKLESIAALRSVLMDNRVTPVEKPKTTEIKKAGRIKGFGALAEIQKEMSGVVDIGLVDYFKWIENAEQISTEIRILKNVARMEFANESKYKRPIYKDAVNVLSSGMKEDELNSFIDDEMLSKTTKEKNLRNFISNNVIKSRRFKYLMRYSNPTVVRTLMQDENLIKFVLGRINKSNPEQLQRYMRSIGEQGEDAVSILTNKLLGLRLEDLFDIKQKSFAGSPDAIKKEKYKAVLGLYLTVAYLAIKNLVNVNSRYVLALSAWARDNRLLTGKEKDIRDATKEDLLIPVNMKIYQEAINKRYCTIFSANERDFIEYAFKQYRNDVAHLSVIENIPAYLGTEEGKKREILSYFELYHFVLQNLIFDKCNYLKGKSLGDKLQAVTRYRTYSKDALNILNLPFGYSLSRYKALTIEPLFDKNYLEERLKELEE